MSDRKHIALLLGRGSESIEAAIGRMARSHGFEVDRLERGEEVLAAAAFDLVIADVDLPGQWTGIELLGALRELGLGARAILFGQSPSFEDCRRAMRLGATDFLTTPVALPELFAAIERALLEETTTGAVAAASASASSSPTPNVVARRGSRRSAASRCRPAAAAISITRVPSGSTR